MGITEPEWQSISRMVETLVARVGGIKSDYFVTGKVIKVDAVNKCVYLAEFGDQAIPVVGFNQAATHYNDGMPDLLGPFAVGATGQPSFLNSWGNYGSGWQTARFWKEPSGVVRLEGLVTGGAVSTIIFQLPSGFRPPLGLVCSGVSVNAFAEIDVAADGSVSASTGTAGWLSLSNVSFQTGSPLTAKTTKKSAAVEIQMPKVGQSVLVAREMGTRRLPRALGVIQGKNWITAEDES